MKRTLFIGDVHGCIQELDDLLGKLDYAPDRDRLFFVGDLIGKGLNSYEVYQRYKETGGQAVLGNHEWHLLERHDHDLEQTPYYIILRDAFGDRFEAFIDDLRSWPLYIEEEDFMLVHAGLVPGRHPRKCTGEELTMIRTWDGKGKDLQNPKNPAWFDLYKEDKLVVFGHWAALEGVERPNAIGLDTGCVYGKKLSALVLPERKIVRVKARKVYSKIKQD
jgi:bis(5'-nucleosyl)-tetraphosphatase (symmetrical)